MWNAVELDTLSGRVRAVSAPDQRQMLVVLTSDGLYGVWFSRAATTLRLCSPGDAEKAFDAAHGTLTWQGVTFPMHGEVGASGQQYGGSLPTTARHGDSLAFDASGRPVGIDTGEGARIPIENPPRAGKWFVAGFSPDSRYLLVADEWEVRLFRYLPPKGGSPARKPSADELALRGAIAAEPDDDTPRLVYADWLQENGQPERAEFIRLQCAHARCLRAGKLFAGEEREQQLLSAYGDLWQAEYPVIRGVAWAGFWRGFPGARVSSATTLVRNAETVWGAAPVESVVIEGPDLAGAKALARCAPLERLRVLELRASPTPTGTEILRTLFAASALSGVWWLAFLSQSRFEPAAVDLIADCANLRNLEFLTLRYCGITDDGARALAASPHLNKLRELDLTGNEFTGDTPSVLRKRFPGVQF